MPTYAVASIQPNPFRHIDRYPIQRKKIAALRESLRTTGFWGNIVARVNNGKPEIAYGHHRLVALKEEYGPKRKVELIIRKLSDHAMLQIMARENMEEWGTSASVEHETIRAVVQAYADGKIELSVPKTKVKADLRYAPGFVMGPDLDGFGPVRKHPYTVQTVAAFLGWMISAGRAQDKVGDALAALQFIEEGLLSESDFDGLSTMQASAVVEETRKASKRRKDLADFHKREAEAAAREAEEAEKRRARHEEDRKGREAEAKTAADAKARREAKQAADRLAKKEAAARTVKQQATKRERSERGKEHKSRRQAPEQARAVGKAVSAGLKAGRIGYKQAAGVALKVEPKHVEKVPPNINAFAERLGTDLLNILDPDRDKRVERLLSLIQYREHIDPHTRTDLAKTLLLVARRASDYANRVEPDAVEGPSPKPGRPALPASTRRR